MYREEEHLEGGEAIEGLEEENIAQIEKRLSQNLSSFKCMGMEKKKVATYERLVKAVILKIQSNFENTNKIIKSLRAMENKIPEGQDRRIAEIDKVEIYL